MIEGIFVDGLIFSIMVMGVLISYRILDFPDLTCDGSFATGAAVATMAIVNGWGIPTALLLSFLAGAVAGMVTATIHNRLKVPGLLAGILTMTMLYSVLRTTTLYTEFPKVFSILGQTGAVLVGTLIIVLVVKELMDVFFRTDLGISIGALGSNEQMIISMGIDPRRLKVIGMGISNAFIALSGGLLAQYQGFADANLGQGMVVQGLAAIMIGEFLFDSNKISFITLRVILGAIIYKALMFLGRYYGYYIKLTPSDLKLLTGILVIVSLLIAQTRSAASSADARKKALRRNKAKREAEIREKEDAHVAD